MDDKEQRGRMLLVSCKTSSRRAYRQTAALGYKQQRIGSA
jgi:hypothetical protein